MKPNKVFILTCLAVALAAGSFVAGRYERPSGPPAAAEAVKNTIYHCPMHPQIVSDKPGECPICHMRLVKYGNEASMKAEAVKVRDKGKPLFYRNPMRADVTSPVPAKDEMGMDYIPVYAEETAKSDPDEVCAVHDCPMMKAGEPCPMLILAEKGEEINCPVCKQRVETAEAASPLPAGYASVLISSQKQQLIGIRTAPVQRKELKRSVLTPARVAYDPDLYQAQIDYLKEYRISQGTLRSRELAYKNLNDSRWEASRIEQARAKLVLMGMDTGSLEELVKNAKADESLLYLKPGGDVWVYASVSEPDAAGMRRGDLVRIDVPSAGNRAYRASVDRVAPMVDPETRRVRVAIRLKNEEESFKPEMLINATIDSPIGSGLAVPEEAVFFTGTAAVVFVDKGNGLFEPRRVEAGAKAGNDYQILSGLSEGETIVMNGNFLLDSESRLKASIERAALRIEEGGSNG